MQRLALIILFNLSLGFSQDIHFTLTDIVPQSRIGPGSRIGYLTTVVLDSLAEGQLSVPIPEGTRLDPHSIQTKGEIVTGLFPEDPFVEVLFRFDPIERQTFVLYFEVHLEATVAYLETQAALDLRALGEFLSDDPQTALPEDPTWTVIGALPDAPEPHTEDVMTPEAFFEFLVTVLKAEMGPELRFHWYLRQFRHFVEKVAAENHYPCDSDALARRLMDLVANVRDGLPWLNEEGAP